MSIILCDQNSCLICWTEQKELPEVYGRLISLPKLEPLRYESVSSPVPRHGNFSAEHGKNESI